jgi:ArsR family transcriptional regulator, arsenate/arsenite/antimonite-responsive transcriptional repressor
MNQPVPLRLFDTNATRRTCDPALQQRIMQNDAVTLANVFKAISHPVRVQILDLISQGSGETCGCDIERHFDLTQPTISHHLKVLRDAGMITSEPRGVWIHHQVNSELIDRIHAYLNILTDAE